MPTRRVGIVSTTATSRRNSHPTRAAITPSTAYRTSSRGSSLARSPALGDFLDHLDPDLKLDWNNRSFLGLPELRSHVLQQASLDTHLSADSVLITAGAA